MLHGFPKLSPGYFKNVFWRQDFSPYTTPFVQREGRQYKNLDSDLERLDKRLQAVGRVILPLT
jgi:hypothetical protein